MNHTEVSDLAPLKKLPLKEIEFANTKVTDPSPLKDIKTLVTINQKPAAEFWKEVDKK